MLSTENVSVRSVIVEGWNYIEFTFAPSSSNDEAITLVALSAEEADLLADCIKAFTKLIPKERVLSSGRGYPKGEEFKTLSEYKSSIKSRSSE